MLICIVYLWLINLWVESLNKTDASFALFFKNCGFDLTWESVVTSNSQLSTAPGTLRQKLQNFVHKLENYITRLRIQLHNCKMNDVHINYTVIFRGKNESLRSDIVQCKSMKNWGRKKASYFLDYIEQNQSLCDVDSCKSWEFVKSRYFERALIFSLSEFLFLSLFLNRIDNGEPLTKISTSGQTHFWSIGWHKAQKV